MIGQIVFPFVEGLLRGEQAQFTQFSLKANSLNELRKYPEDVKQRWRECEGIRENAKSENVRSGLLTWFLAARAYLTRSAAAPLRY